MIFRLRIKWIHKRTSGSIRRNLSAFEDATHHPQQCQEFLLQQILRRQAATDFGREHHFAAIRTPTDFQHNVPVAGYEYIDPYISRVRRGDFKALLSEPTVHMFALTSGTTKDS